MRTATAYKNLYQNEKQFLSDIAKEVAVLAADSKKKEYFVAQIREFSEKWAAYKTAFDADRRGKWEPSMGKPRNPLETIWPGSAGARRFPFCGGDIRQVLGAYALLAVIHDKVLPRCPSIAKAILPKELLNRIWHDLVTGACNEHRIVETPAGTIGLPVERDAQTIPRGKIERVLRDVKADIENRFAPRNKTEQKLAEPKQDTKPPGKTRQTKPVKVPISELIKQGEGHTLEFKETLEWDIKQNQHNPRLNKECLKTIAAFLNTDGGTLLIGVRDNGQITGIDRDLQYVQRKNQDGFEQKLRSLIQSHFAPHPLRKVKVTFKKLAKGTVCRIDVSPASPSQVVHLDKDVYVREGNTTVKLDGRVLTDWIQQRGPASGKRVESSTPSGWPKRKGLN